MGVVDDLVQARETFERGEWMTAFEAWADADPALLQADDLVSFAEAAQLLGHHEQSVAALQTAFQRRLDDGDAAGAVRCAFWLSMVFSSSGDQALAAGWTARADRLLEDLGDVVERGYLAFLHMFGHLGAQDFAGALAEAGVVLEHGRRFGDPDLVALGLSATGRLTLYTGPVPDGLALFDEAMVGVTAGEVSPVLAGTTYCVMIEGCQEVSDLRRAAAWTTALHHWCQRQPGLVAFTGQCAVHRGQIMRAHGAFEAAVTEFDAAIERYLASPSSEAAGLAYAERGDVLRLLGRLDDAEASYELAADHGYEPQPGLALLWLTRGRPEAALGAVRRLLLETGPPVPRSRLLPSAIDVLLAVGELDQAREVTRELDAVGADFGCTALLATAAHADGRLELEAGDAAGALPYLRKALGMWQELGCRYEVARVRVQVGRALLALDDTQSAAAEIAAAHRVFVELGAEAAAAEAASLRAPSALPAGLTSREVEVLRLVAAGRSNAQIAGALVLSEKTVARHLSNIFTKLGVGSRTAAAAFAFEHRLV